MAMNAEELADSVLSFVNAYGFDSKTFAKTIARGHKTLQQSTMRLFLAAIEEMSKVYPDDRNKQTVELAGKIMELAKNYTLPLI